MNKFWKMFKHEYTRHVLRKRFIFALLSVPLWILFAIGMAILSVLLVINHAPVGYVDQANLITIRALPKASTSASGLVRVEFESFPNESAARAALDAKKIQAYFVLPPDYRESQKSRLVYLESPTAAVRSQFDTLIQLNLLADQPAQITKRLINGPDLVIQATRENRKAANSDWVKTVAPLVAGLFLMISIFTSSGYLMQAVVEEKENRTMELLATSASPTEIMASKITALVCVGLTQVLVWSIFPLIGLMVAAAYVPFLQNLTIDWRLIGLIFATSLPTFVLIAALMATIGSTITEAREGQQISTLITLPVMAPYMLAALIIANPGGPIAVILTIFPLTASLTLLMRMAFAAVPSWQIYVSVGLLILSAVGALWLAGRVFRMGMLRYGKRMGWKDVFQAVLPDRGQGRNAAVGKEAV